jgi:hypothetical protein
MVALPGMVEMRALVVFAKGAQVSLHLQPVWQS